ncbi:MAG: protein-disulfide reductase DsbD domain-containing protein, partial [Luminiphilus sp.]
MPRALTHRLALLLLLVPLWAQGQGLGDLVAKSAEFLPVDEAYRLEVERADDGSLRLYWQIEDAYYLYQHRFKATLEDADGTVPTRFEFSPALEKTDEFFGDVRVYYNYADLRLLAERSFGSARLSVTYQGCADAGLCYPPHTQHFLIDAASGTITPDTG